jgi:aerobic carbon-monoxide dehydrogenase large subunit
LTSTILLEKEKEQAKVREEPLRTEDFRLMTGRGRYVGDYSTENIAYMSLVHSPRARAKIKRIDLSRVSSTPNFIAALTGEDLVKEGVSPVGQGFIPSSKSWTRYHLALGEVRFVGEPVVAILAKDRASAEDLAEDVVIEYEELSPITTLEESKQGKVLLYDDWKDNLFGKIERKKGDAERAIASAAYVINAREGIRRQDAAPIEPHAVVASYDKDRAEFQVFATVQSVHSLLEVLTHELKLPKNKFHIKVMDMGGGFGTKGGPVYPWTLLACLFARKTGLTVKWEASRTEEFLESAPSRDEYCDITLACDKDGKILALKGRIECDIGVPGSSSFMVAATVGTIVGPYEIPNLDLVALSYATNKMPVGPVRGAGRPEGCYFTERAMGIMAKKIGLDSIEFRRRNVSSNPKKSSEEDYPALLDFLTKSTDYDGILQWRDEFNSRAREENNNASAKIAGVGTSLSSGLTQFSIRAIIGGISLKGIIAVIKFLPRFRTFSGETAKVTLNKNGQVTVYTGSSPHGQGHETAFAQLASEELGVPFEKVMVIWGNTDLIPEGVGTFGSRSASAGGSALVDASRKLKKDVIKKASRILRISQNQLTIQNGNIVEGKEPQNVLIRLDEVLDRLQLSELSAESKFAVRGSEAYSSAAHLCAVVLDTETGRVRIEKYAVAEDCGRIINKAIVEGQIHGGVLCGVGGALLEKLVYDDDGNLLTTSFLDYSIPNSSDCISIDIFHKVTPSTSLNHTKGVGESGTIASYAAVINALNDAVSQFKKRKGEVDDSERSSGLDIAPAFPETIRSAILS